MRRRIKIVFACMTALIMAATSCINSLQKDFEEYSKTKESSGKWKPTECTLEDVRIKSFKASATENEHILGDLVFTYKDQSHYVGSVHHYELKDKKLRIAFNAVAAKVEVEGKELKETGFDADFTNPVTLRLYDSEGQYKEIEFAVVQEKFDSDSRIPVISLTVNNGIRGKDWADGIVRIAGLGSGFPDASYTVKTKLRGHNSYSVPKKSYTLKLPEKVAFLGMPGHKRWTLIANGSDRTLLRNRVAYEIGSRTNLAWTPRTNYCILLVDGTYKGLYLVVEQIRTSKNRVNITEMTEKDISGEALTGGYLLECDRYPDERSFKTAIRDLPINIKSPDEKVLQKEQQEYIENYLKKIEQLLYARETPDPAYKNYIDISSFVDAWIVLELTHCRDARLPGSIWYYKDRGGKLFAGPVWDFDLTTFINSKNFLLYDYETEEFTSSSRSLWYSRLFMDPEFKALAKEHWQSYYPSFKEIPSYIDAQAALIKDAAAENFALWRTISSSNGDDNLTWAEAVEKMKASYSARLEALNQQITAW